MTSLAAILAVLPLAGTAKPAFRTSFIVPAFDDVADSSVTPKPTPPIAITHRLTSAPQVGQPVEVILSITAEGDMTGVSLDLAADDPLAMIDPLDSLGIGALRAGEAADVAVTVLPLLDQTHYLSVTVTAMINGTLQTRSIAVPIRLPGSEQKRSENEVTGKERVRSFQATETVH